MYTLRELQRVTEHPKHGSPGTANYIGARTQWFDQAVASAKQLGITQVVIIAAGFDSRAYRLHTSGLKVPAISSLPELTPKIYEIDLPHASTTKQKLVDKVLPDAAKHSRPVFVGADLSECSLKHALHETGFDPVEPSLFLCEGLLYYLPQGANSLLCQPPVVGKSASAPLLVTVWHVSALCSASLPTLFVTAVIQKRRHASGRFIASTGSGLGKMIP
ncbi:hypothetical protein ABBQ38_014642 [Trebouxia sp. C0009 RCD-2024]